MAEGKTSFTVYCDWIDTFEELTDEEAGKLIKHVLRYVNDLNPSDPDRVTKLLFAPIKATLKRDLSKWLKKADINRSNGSLGGRPKKTEDNPKEPTGLIDNPKNPEEPVRVSVRVRDRVSKKEIELYSFLEFWEDYDYKTGKAAAEKSWKKLTLEEKTRVKETVKDFRSYKPFPDYQHPMPSSYLNQKRFNDEIETLKEEKIDVNLWVKNHLTYDESLGEVAIRCDNYPEYSGLYYNRKTSKFQKEKAI
jgi:hypothetical protein